MKQRILDAYKQICEPNGVLLIGEIKHKPTPSAIGEEITKNFDDLYHFTLRYNDRNYNINIWESQNPEDRLTEFMKSPDTFE